MPILNWLGKDKVINHHQQVPYRVLEPQYTYGQADSGNMLIHGDNLDALKSLFPRFEGNVKCIYIDPPYNTAKSSEKNKQWIYTDSVDHPKIKAWIGKTVGDEGEDLSRHDKWLCMMYPRLKLLQKLLSDDGIIFISIDDHEQANLKIICDEIFGKNNFLAQLVWRSDGNFDNQAKIKMCHEYILVYTKVPDLLGLPEAFDPTVSGDSKIFKDEIRNTLVKNGPKNPMSQIILPKGFPCAVETLTINERHDLFPYYHNTAYINNYELSNEVVVESGWSSKNILLNFIANQYSPVPDSKGQNTRFVITATGAIEMIKEREKISHVLSILYGLSSTQNMSNELLRMNIKFDFPKPKELITYLLSFYCNAGDIILDSFAGSGTTAHAVLNMNKVDHKNRRFIMVEMEDYAETVTAERVKQVIDGYDDIEGTGGGFAYYELGERLLLEDGNLNENLDDDKISEYVWYTETRTDYTPQDERYLLGVRANTAYYFYYIKQRITVLDHDFLHSIKTSAGSYLIYADINTLSAEEMDTANIRFKKIPRDITRL